MTVWEMQFANVNEHAMLVYADLNQHAAGLFNIDGKEKVWQTLPHIMPAPVRGKKKEKPIADFPAFLPGALVLNERACALFRDFLEQYGQLLAMNCLGKIFYLFNVTNMLDCINVDASAKIGKSIRFPVFFENAIPQEAIIFKDPRTVRTAIYLNDAAAEKTNEIIKKNNLSGLGIIKAGSAIPVS